METSRTFHVPTLFVFSYSFNWAVVKSVYNFFFIPALNIFDLSAAGYFFCIVADGLFKSLRNNDRVWEKMLFFGRAMFVIHPAFQQYGY